MNETGDRAAQLRSRLELSSYTLQMAAGVLRALRVQVEDLERRLAAEEDDAALRSSAAETGQRVERLWRFLREAGVEPARGVLPPEFVGEAPTIVVEAAAPAAPAPSGTAGAPAAVAAPAHPAVVVTAARWAGRRPGAPALRLRALADGAADGTPATVRVYVRGDDRAIAFVEATVQRGAVDAVWAYGAGVTAALEPPAEHALFFTVEVAGVLAESDLLAATELF